MLQAYKGLGNTQIVALNQNLEKEALQKTEQKAEQIKILKSQLTSELEELDVHIEKIRQKVILNLKSDENPQGLLLRS